MENKRNSKIQKNKKVGFKGVSFSRSGKKFQASICINNRIIYLGTFITAEEAHAAYCTAATRYFGEFARMA
jgi:hypothetical protein